MTRPLKHVGRAAAERPLLRIKALSASYGGRPVLRRMSLEVMPREIVTLVGRNGAGKSTLLQAVAGFVEASEGSVWFGGADVTRLAPHERARCGMGYFMQGGRIFPSLTVEENIEMGAARLPRSERADAVETVLSLFPHLIGQSRMRGGYLSGGERQALALAVVLVGRPSLLLLDEPSAGLSSGVARDLVERLRDIATRWGTAVLLVEQNIREAVAVADRVVALVNGCRFDLDEPPATVLSSPLFEEVFFGKTLR